jgi:hypothetical protein
MAATMSDPGESQDGAAAPRGLDRAGAIVAELVEAVGATTAALAAERAAKAAAEISTVAEAARSAAGSFDRSDHPRFARGLDRAADEVDAVAQLVRRRDWQKVAAAIAGFAQRRPSLFGLGAITVGFATARLLLSPLDREAPGSESSPRAEAGVAKSGIGADGGPTP